MQQFKTTVRTLTLALGFTGTLLSLPVMAQTSVAESTAVQQTAEQQQTCACFAVKVVGKGPAVILIPGLASSGDVWQTTVEALKNDYQLHILTLAGFAGTAPLPAEQWTAGYLQVQQQAILRYISEQQLEKPVVIGHSLGGYLALALASSASDKIGSAINVDGLPALGALFAQNSAATASTDTASANTKSTTAKDNKTPQQPTGGFDPMLMAKGMTNNQAWQQRIVTDMARSDGMTSGRVMGELMRADLRPQLTNIKVPVLTLGALQNGAPYATPAQVQSNYQTQLANAPTQYHNFAFAADSKHFIMADAPDWLNQQIRQFLQKNAAVAIH
ncbi:alpha/beta hydrolase [Rheinheimera sp. SA_1]|uniref:alpha/beta fold hydrolase n=1 Tax=Rheinheimera sp. SA_1 TaxID=1827365 RepID=UPI0007FC7888|nr:alpha/beta hydrolase [Rheinheimera sp. SA_1]OBP13407.1 alpha/beta hydrolase [Rheinheimera sp. SA_1]